jgi:hypothetical protein
LNTWRSSGVFFVVRHKENLKFKTIKENELPENRHQHILKDEKLIEIVSGKIKILNMENLKRL